MAFGWHSAFRELIELPNFTGGTPSDRLITAMRALSAVALLQWADPAVAPTVAAAGPASHLPPDSQLPHAAADGGRDADGDGDGDGDNGDGGDAATRAATVIADTATGSSHRRRRPRRRRAARAAAARRPRRRPRRRRRSHRRAAIAVALVELVTHASAAEHVGEYKADLKLREQVSSAAVVHFSFPPFQTF